MTDARTGGKSPYWLSWTLLILALVVAVAVFTLSFFGASPLWLLLACPVVWALVFAGLLLGNRATRRIREEAEH